MVTWGPRGSRQWDSKVCATPFSSEISPAVQVELSGARGCHGLAKGVSLQAGLSIAGKAGAEGLGRLHVRLPGATDAL